MYRSELQKVASSDDLGELLNRGFRYALSLTHDQAAAEDLIQDAAVAMIEREAHWEPSYLFTTIRNRFIDRYRRDQRVTFVSLESETDTDIPHAGSEEPFDSLEAARLREAMSSLRVDERESLYLAVVEGYTAEEIAQLTERPRGTVLSLLFRAKRKLRDSLLTIARPFRRDKQGVPALLSVAG